MSLSLVQSRALVGLQAAAVTVEVHLANGLPSFTLVGLADVEVKEARERVRSALQNCGLEFPHNKRITVNLAPADLPKDSGRFDLPIALGILAASGQVDAARLAGYEFAGELSLSGELRPVRGALAMSLALHAAGADARLVLPPGSAEEAALVPQAQVYRRRPPAGRGAPVPALAGAGAGRRLGARRCRSRQRPAPATRTWPTSKARPAPSGRWKSPRPAATACCCSARRARANRCWRNVSPACCPPMTVEEALQTAAIASLAGQFSLERWGLRPTCSPHHTASAVALVGGGSPPRPGEISLAHHGVLFLDELPEFPRAALEALREPLETGHITISRAARRAEFPARFQFIGAMNPCPCGCLGSPHKACRCTPDQVARYQGKLSGPLLDRIDLHVEVPTLRPSNC